MSPLRFVILVGLSSLTNVTQTLHYTCRTGDLPMLWSAPTAKSLRFFFPFAVEFPNAYFSDPIDVEERHSYTRITTNRITIINTLHVDRNFTDSLRGPYTVLITGRRSTDVR